MLRCMSNLLQAMSGPEVVVRYAHMELADPDIARGFADCVNGGASVGWIVGPILGGLLYDQFDYGVPFAAAIANC